MKNLIKTFGVLVLILCSIIACKKEEPVQSEEAEQLFSVAIEVATQRGTTEKAIMIGTKKELESALKEETTYLKKISVHNNVFAPVVGPVTPPVDLCWEEINSFYNAHFEQWLQIANQTCQNVMVCLTCPKAGGGLFVMYDIAPTSPKCLTATAQLAFEKFDFSENDYDTDAVAQYITSRR